MSFVLWLFQHTLLEHTPTPTSTNRLQLSYPFGVFLDHLPFFFVVFVGRERFLF